MEQTPVVSPAKTTDEELLERIAAGDAGALGDLYDSYGRIVFAVMTPPSDARAISPCRVGPAGREDLGAWIVRGQQPLAAGISGDRSGVVTLVLSQPLRPGDGVAVTLEDAGGVSAPRGAVVLQGRT